MEHFHESPRTKKMPVLTYQLGDAPRAIPVLGTLTVGRGADNDIVLRHPTVSRHHATLEVDSAGAVWVRDAGSSNGTQVDGVPVAGRRRLPVPCRLRVGRVRVWFRETTPSWLDGAAAGQISIKSPVGERTAEGVVRRCACGGKMWLVPTADAQKVFCRRCGRPVGPEVVGEASDDKAGAANETLVGAAVDAAPCPVCRWGVEPGDVTRRCASCEVVYHAECWEQNRGCATFGCPEVGAADAAEPVKAPVSKALSKASSPEEYDDVDALTAARDTYSEEPPRRLPRPSGLLVASGVAAVVGLPAFGLPPLATAGAAAVALTRRRDGQPGGVAAVLVGLIGAAAGSAFSYWLWLGGFR